MTYPQPITAVPAGTKADGSPIDRRVAYLLDRAPEHTFGGEGRSRLFYRVKAAPSLRREYDVHVCVVRTDSITDAEPTTIV